MKPIYLHFAAGIAATFALGTSAACAQQGEQSGQDTTSVVEADGDHWLDAPQTLGDWAYVSEEGASFAYFGDRTNPETRHFMLRCDHSNRQVMLARASAATSELLMRVRTETQDRMINAAPVPMTGLIAAQLDANDPLLDAMAITKGRFSIEVEGMEPLYIPAWAEVSRVIEDCR